MKKKINGPWKTMEILEKYRNKWVRVFEETVIRPDGQDGIFVTIKIMNGVSILPLDEDGYVYFIKQFRYTLGEKSIEVVSGGTEKNEKPLKAAKRELEEEAGIIANKWISLGFINPLTTIVKSVADLYLVRELHFLKSTPDSTERIEILKIKLEKAVEMVMKNKIFHAASCVLILKAFEYLKNQDNKFL